VYYSAYLKISKKNLTPKLFLHSLGVGECAVALARRYGANPQKAFVAGILHDYGKKYKPRTLRKYAYRRGLKLDRVTRKVPQLLHAPVGAELLKEEIKLKDASILESIRYHTTGSPGLSLLGKIIFLADVIEEGRSFPGIEELRGLAFVDLRKALLAATENTIKMVLDNNCMLHPRSVSFRNELIRSVY